MIDVTELLAELQALADEYRSSTSSAAATALRSRYLQRLEQVLATDFEGGVGWQRELPDEFLPAVYLQGRQRQLSELEDDLGSIAARYRSSATEALGDVWARKYRETFDEMLRLGHWNAIPDPDSQLPLELMPPAFVEQRAARIRQGLP